MTEEDEDDSKQDRLSLRIGLKIIEEANFTDMDKFNGRKSSDHLVDDLKAF